MMLQLFLKECKYILRSLTYYIYFACVMFMFVSQVMPEISIIGEPKVGQEDYGFKYSDDQNKIEKAALKSLVREYTTNTYTAYPFGFYKRITLNETKQNNIQGILMELTGLSKEELEKNALDYYSQFNISEEEYTVDEEGNMIEPVVVVEEEMNISMLDTITYNYFLELMEKADSIIGGGSNYRGAYLNNLAIESKTYEDALKEYHEIIQKDKVTGAYARVFCDYLGIFLVILPVFVAVTVGLRDRRAKCRELIYVRNTSSKAIVISRYLAMVVMMFIPVALLAVKMTFEFIDFSNSSGIVIDIFAFIKYSVAWLLPSIMVAIAIGTICTEIFEAAVGIAVQGIWWIISLFQGMQYINGGYSNLLLIRHNELGNYDIYQDNLTTLIANRIGYTVLAMVLIGVTVLIYEGKRKGKLHAVRTILSNRKSKLKA